MRRTSEEVVEEAMREPTVYEALAHVTTWYIEHVYRAAHGTKDLPVLFECVLRSWETQQATTRNIQDSMSLYRAPDARVVQEFPLSLADDAVNPTDRVRPGTPIPVPLEDMLFDAALGQVEGPLLFKGGVEDPEERDIWFSFAVDQKRQCWIDTMGRFHKPYQGGRTPTLSPVTALRLLYTLRKDSRRDEVRALLQRTDG